MAEEAQYGAPEAGNNKRKYDDQTIPSPGPRRPTGFSAPIASLSPSDGAAPPSSYNNVPPPMDDFQLAKQKAQEIAARLLNSAEAKKPRVDNNGGGAGAGGYDSYEHKPIVTPSVTSSYGYPGQSKKIEIPNGRVGVIIGKGGETIKYLQLQSGAKIQVTRDMDADPNSTNRAVELMGTPDQIAKAEQLITEVLSEADSGGSGLVSRRLPGQQSGGEQFSLKVPNNKVGLVIGKGGETIKSMQARTGARIQVIPLHLPPGDTSQERTVQIDGSSEQIEAAKQLVYEVISERRLMGIVVHFNDPWMKEIGSCCASVFGRKPFSNGYEDQTSFEIRSALRTISMSVLCVLLLIVTSTAKFAFLIIEKWNCCPSSAMWHVGICSLAVLLMTYIIILWFPLLLVPLWSTSLMGEPNSSSDCSSWNLKGEDEHLPGVCTSQPNRARNQGMSGGYQQQGYQARPPTSWAPPGAPMQQSGYGYGQPGAYPSQPSYPGYPPQPASAGYASGWDQSAAQNQQSQAGGYDYYNQQAPQQQQQTAGGSAASTDTSAYGYNQQSASGYSQGQAYAQDGYGGYHAPAPQSGGYQGSGYEQQQGYSSTAGYGNASNPTSDGQNSSYGTQSDGSQAPPPASATGQQGYHSGQQPSPNPSYPSQGSAQAGYGVPPTSQGGYGTQPAGGYATSYGTPQAQKPPSQASYGQPQQSPSAQAGYAQPPTAQPGYPPAAQSGYAQADPNAQRPPSSAYGAPPAQPGYGAQSYGAPPNYGQQPPPYNSAYGGYSQPPAYASEAAPTSQSVPPSGGVAKASPQS
ncbi:hypothetical protein H5410_063407 [Solanum commersonii]|uniref:K Homology domain-containing protein n=1 Tax=Solanum commersonii TaxID=4109 RepID=A0A9J5WD67_SOLCO|nr:hypothetical protein H5410_063407 [Solanum commersonii]